MEETNERFRLFEYEVTTDDSDIEGRVVDKQIRAILQNTFEKVQRKKNGVIGELNDLIRKYPEIPHFKNQLFIAYAQQGNSKMASQLNELTIKEHPDYLFGKLNLAGEYILRGEYEKVPEVLGDAMEIKDLYPDRNKFHINEVASFYKTAINYFLGVENIEAAEGRLEILRNLPEDYFTDVGSLENQIMSAKFQRNLRQIQNQKNIRKHKTIVRSVVQPTTIPPVFHHPEIEMLYQYDLQIDHAILQTILALPKETLLHDLHKAIYDSIARFDHIAEDEFYTGDTEFPLHALLLMTQLGDVRSLPVMLDVLRQNEDYLDFYYGDHLTETFWEIIMKLGAQQPEVLKAFMLEGNYHEFSRSVITAAMEQIALHFPERKEEVIQWYRDILLFFLENINDDSLIDMGVISGMVGDLVALRAVSMEPLIEELYRENLVFDFYAGSLESVKNDLHSPTDQKYSNKRELLSIYDRYDHILKTWASYNEDEWDEDEMEDWDEDEVEDWDDDESDDWDNEKDIPSIGFAQPVVRSEPKIGRNDPCPCGSGKKYKKCHGK
ncbi:MAG: DUF1186 domain-containing protein [Bacteroidota bacterium]|nr:DUF1186 domain-containing protein [Bacteroidota bacterium]